MPETNEPLWDRTLRRIRELWPLGDPVALKDAIAADLPENDLPRVRARIDACIEGKGGEVSARARAAEIGEAYSVLTATGRRRFLELLAKEYDVDNDEVEKAISARREVEDLKERQQATSHLRDLLEPPRAQLLRQFNDLQGGVKFLVNLRSELMGWARKNPELQALDRDVYRLLASWFDVGFLDLQQITWHTPAALLEKLIKYEAVHEITSWKDLKNRLEEDRRCYAFFHPRMPDEPLIFVEVALVNGISANIHELLDEKAPPGDPEKADTAIFYSISNCQEGLAGVSFGNFLIKRVVADLVAKLPNLKTFSTLSPIPGFAKWLKEQEEDVELSGAAAEAIELLTAKKVDSKALSSLIGDDKEKEEEKSKGVKQTLLRLCARYLLEAKHNEQVRDRVAHFHLTNGATVKQINWAANLSRRGIEQSAGMMVNYLYDLPSIEKHHEEYRSQGEIAATAGVKKLAK
jgi:malonyl-CoA decarboxylase